MTLISSSGVRPNTDISTYDNKPISARVGIPGGVASGVRYDKDKNEEQGKGRVRVREREKSKHEYNLLLLCFILTQSTLGNARRGPRNLKKLPTYLPEWERGRA